MTLHAQGLRFVVVGLFSNVVLYLLYLGLTWLGLGHKTAMTLLYMTGTIQTFFLNKHWTFNHVGSLRASSLRYLVAYGAGYVLNLGTLYLFVDNLGLPHTMVQGIAIFVIAALLFLLQKYWVFSGDRVAADAIS